MNVPYSYLQRQFTDLDAYLEDIRHVVQSGDFTLGAAVERFEEAFAALTGLPYAVGVGSGTDALILPLRALGVGPGDEVITSPNTFVASAGSIVMAGARPVFVDSNEQYTIDARRIEAAITPRTKAILPVHLTGNPADMPAIMAIADRHGLAVVEDAAQAILASIDGRHVGSWGAAAGFSLHPLKNLNVWGDGGIIVTRSLEMRDKLRLLRNHGMATREAIQVWGGNSRLDSVQAVIALRLMSQVRDITARRIANACRFDEAFADMADVITIPERKPQVCQVFHTYVIRAGDRDRLVGHLLANGVRAKVHYPVPLHLQPAAAGLGYKVGDFPICEADCRSILTLPVHQHLAPEEIDWVAGQVRRFYGRT
jgi:dTDP-3-amino-2,3,6-trideoxy-4-keto-D-glucose/dTDP-3-amino-3,4,6-trideoxy-alpha-D-glucose/dTDP-2,6-dideoxy-D-kanosamine transaminase